MTLLRQHLFWRRTRRLTLGLLLVWLALSLGVPWFARTFDRVHAFGFPLGWWLAAQGALLGFLVIVVVYVACMDRLEALALAPAASADAPAADATPLAGRARRGAETG
jgi:putative solute:sodium symporter small subunit